MKGGNLKQPTDKQWRHTTRSYDDVLSRARSSQWMTSVSGAMREVSMISVWVCIVLGARLSSLISIRECLVCSVAPYQRCPLQHSPGRRIAQLRFGHGSGTWFLFHHYERKSLHMAAVSSSRRRNVCVHCWKPIPNISRQNWLWSLAGSPFAELQNTNAKKKPYHFDIQCMIYDEQYFINMFLNCGLRNVK